MRPSGRIDFIDNLTRALNRKDPGGRSLDDLIQKAPDADDSRLLEQIAGRDNITCLALLERLMESAKLVNVSVIVLKDAAAAGAAISKIAADKSAEWGDRKSIVAWNHPLVTSLSLATCLEPMDIPVHIADTDPGTTDQRGLCQHAETAFIGVTSADYCIADTATLSMKTRPGQPRCVSLLPSMHIAVIRLEQILSNLNEFYTLMKWHLVEKAEGITRCMTLITGPSKTADIEATLVYGAHGPRELSIVVLTG